MDIDIFKAAKEGKCSEVSKHTGEIELLDKEGNTALMLAAMYGHSCTIKTLFREGARVDALGKGLNSALMFACRGGHAEAVGELLVAGASVDIFNEDGENPLHIAVRGGYEAIVALLLDGGADVNAVDRTNDWSPLFLAVISKYHRVVTLLLKRGANPNYRSPVGNTPLVEASANNIHQSVVLLLQHGADPNIITSETKNSALYWSSKNGAYATAKALLDAGTNPHNISKSGHTPLTITADELMKRLIRTYQSGGPSWLVQQLCARGLEWPVVCDIEDKLLKEGFVSKEILLAAPMSLFTHEYLRSLGITHFGTRLVVITVRLEGTWLGARLAGLGVSPFWIRSCETCVFEALGCGTKKAYANLPAAALSAEALKEVGVPVQYHLVLRALHEQLGKAHQEKNERKENKHSAAATVTSSATSSAAAKDGHVERTVEDAV